MSEDAIQRLEERLSRLEALLGLSQKNQPSTEVRAWERIIGSRKNDSAFAEIARLGRKIRRADKPLEQRSVRSRKHSRGKKAKQRAGKD